MNDILQECYEYYADLRGEMDLWLKQSMVLDPPGPNGGGEDEANYALAWFPHYLVTGDQTVLKHFGDLKSALAGWIERECLHGYEPEAEAHHGTEPFLLFLPRYIDLVPDDQEACSMLTDAAEHIGNWVEEIPAWYDYDRDTFYGYFIGSRTVQPDAEAAYEVAEHFRFIHIALATYRITREERYLDWSMRYGKKRAERIVAAKSPMPLLWDLDGNGLGEAEVEERGLHRLAAQGTHHTQAIRWLGLKICLLPVRFTHWEISTICRGIQFSEMQRSELLSRWLNLCLIPTTTPALPQSATTGGHSGIPPLISAFAIS